MLKTYILKKCFITIFALFFSTAVCFANIFPVNVNDIPQKTMGVYQTDEIITVYEKPDNTSTIVYNRTVDYAALVGVKRDSFFAVLIPKKNLGYAYATNISDDEEWIEIIYNKDKNLKGWVRKNDDFQFLPWGNFYNLYGRKYGLIKLKNQQIELNGIFSQPDESGQVLGTLSRPKFIHLTSLEGNWMLISVLDLSGQTTTGYLQWRTNDGKFLLFPDIK